MNTRFCDCSQGRFGCTCKPERKLGAPYANPPSFYRDVAEAATSRARATWIELNALKWKLRIVETLALIGWAGFVLTLMGS